MKFIIQFILMPFSILYGIVNTLRNYLYDKKWLTSVRFAHPVISIGNLSVGGTGKTPHIEYLLAFLKPYYAVATLSRGYGRKTAGIYYANPLCTAADIGDEPMQFHMKHPDIPVVVAENRLLAIPDILGEYPSNQCILLDDAMQHRRVKPGLNIMLTEYSRMFYDDYIIPAGRLREPASSYHRADIIIVTKCPKQLSSVEREGMINKIKPHSYQHVYFSTILYGPLYPMFSGISNITQLSEYDVLLITGIANNQKIIDYLKPLCATIFAYEYKDHHYYDRYDLEKIHDVFSQSTNSKKIIVTTEKDATRLVLEKEYLLDRALPIYILPIQVAFLAEDKQAFENDILQYINTTLQKHSTQITQ